MSKSISKQQDDHSLDRVRTWIEIDTKAIGHNIKQFRKMIDKKTKMLAMVKSNAYGHNLVEYGRVLEKLKVDWLGVDSLVEGVRLRSEGVATPVLVLGFTLPTMYEDARKKDIAITVSSFEMLEQMLMLPRSAKKLRLHIKVDTGMHRQGFQWEDHERLINMLKEKTALSVLSIEGLFTHFADAKSPREQEFTKKQINEFGRWRALFAENGFSVLVHAAATGGAIIYDDAHFDMVRIGIGIYGLWPSKSIEDHYRKEITLKPVLSWKTIVGEVKLVKKGERIGYDLTETLTRDTKVAIVPIGYWHGFRRAMSSKGRLLISGRTARVLGRVSMDMIAVDVTDIPKVRMGTEAVIIGRSGKDEISAGEVASIAGTTHYEVVTTINPLIKKFFV